MTLYKIHTGWVKNRSTGSNSTLKNKEKIWYTISSFEASSSKKSNLKFITFILVYYFTNTVGNVLLIAAYITTLDELKITEQIVTYHHFLVFQTFEEFLALAVQCC